jgi:hypothetical protein
VRHVGETEQIREKTEWKHAGGEPKLAAHDHETVSGVSRECRRERGRRERGQAGAGGFIGHGFRNEGMTRGSFVVLRELAKAPTPSQART